MIVQNVSLAIRKSVCGEKYGLPVSSVERENPSLLHARLGAYLAHEKYGVKDEEIIYAIEAIQPDVRV